VHSQSRGYISTLQQGTMYASNDQKQATAETSNGRNKQRRETSNDEIQGSFTSFRMTA
jgi:hypothetical protein